MAIPSRADKIGYARVSTPDQKLDAQLDALQQAGCGQMFSDQVSGITADRPGWERLLAYVRPGDTVIVTELSRMTRSRFCRKFCSGGMKGQLTLAVGGLSGQGVELFGRAEARLHPPFKLPFA